MAARSPSTAPLRTSRDFSGLLECWYLGQVGGTAAAKIILGDVSPGGKLPLSFPRNVGELPDYYNHKPSMNRSYLFNGRKPVFPFGFGLSYTLKGGYALGGRAGRLRYHGGTKFRPNHQRAPAGGGEMN